MTIQSRAEQAGSGLRSTGSGDAAPKRLAIPYMEDIDLAFGNIKHMPKYETLPKEFQDWHHHPFCEAISHWFMKGAQASKNGIQIGTTKYIAKDGVDAGRALAATKAILASWSPKHEHKIAACGFMLHEWFDVAPTGKAA